MRRVGVIFALLAAASCGETASVAKTTSAITNGTPSGEPRVIALADDAGATVCSAVVLRPRVAITAAHCGPAARLRALHAVFGSEAASGRHVAILEATVHPSYEPTTLRDDLALLLLGEDAPEGTELSTIDATLVGRDVRLVGFGIIAADAGTTAGRRREGTARIERIEDTTVRVVPAPSLTCAADSGGAAFIDVDGATRLVGITSRGDGACASHTVLSRVDVAWTSFVEPFVRDASPGAAADLATCYGDAHCARGKCVVAADAPAIRYCAPPCGGGATCPTGLRCADGFCIHPTPTPGALGSTCTPTSCRVGECRSVASAEARCTHRCLPDVGCEAGFDCVHEQGTAYYCVPRGEAPRDDADGCAYARPARQDAWLLTGAALALLVRRRARRSCV